MVLTNWDHTMVSVQKLDSGIKTFADNGIIFELGGRHDAWGTTNALGYFGINYIELVNVFDAQKANSFTRSSSSSAYDAVQDFNHQREQLNTVAIRTNDLEGIRQRLKQAGIAVGQILEGDRVDKQNQLIKWKTFFIDDDIEGLPYPFFIDWQQADTDRVVQLEKQGLIQQHPAGKLNVIKAVFEVNEPQKVSQQWANLIESFVIKKEGKFIVPIQDKIFEFVQGDANHLIALHISGAQSELHQKTISLGDAKFVFE